MATTSNDRLATLEEQRNLEMIDSSLDFKRIANPRPLLKPGRTLVRKGLVTILKLNSKGKLLKSKEIDMILLTDMLIYGKPFEKVQSSRFLAVIISLVDACRQHLSEGFQRQRRPSLN
jgi:hypothetical protein